MPVLAIAIYSVILSTYEETIFAQVNNAIYGLMATICTCNAVWHV